MIIIKKEYLAVLAIIILGLVVVIGSIPKHYEYPEEHFVQNFPVYEQPDGITCGPTSAMLVLNFYDKNLTLNEVKKKTKTHWYGGPQKEVGMTAPDMIVSTLKSYGMKSKLKNNNLDELKYEISQNRPVIVLVRSGKKTWHYMVAIGYSENTISFSDPASATRYAVTMDNFLSAWSFDGNCFGEDFRASNFFGGKTGDYMKILILATEIHANTYITTDR